MTTILSRYKVHKFEPPGREPKPFDYDYKLNPDSSDEDDYIEQEEGSDDEDNYNEDEGSENSDYSESNAESEVGDVESLPASSDDGYFDEDFESDGDMWDIEVENFPP
mgnify:CR=1 FL=1